MGKSRTEGETEIEKKKRATGKNVTNSIHGAAEGNLCCISIDSKNLGSYIYIYISYEGVKLVRNWLATV